MKPILLRLGAISFSLITGVTVSNFLRLDSRPNSKSPPIANVSTWPSRCELNRRGDGVIISLPSDDDLYIGKTRIDRSQVTEKVRKLLDDTRDDERVVVVRSAPGVRFETLNMIIRKIKDADVNHIEFVVDKKKKTGLK